MQPTLVREPFHRPGCVYEEKYDGWRMLAFKDGDRVRVVSRNGRDHTVRFAEIAEVVARSPAHPFLLEPECHGAVFGALSVLRRTSCFAH